MLPIGSWSKLEVREQLKDAKAGLILTDQLWCISLEALPVDIDVFANGFWEVVHRTFLPAFLLVKLR